MLQSAKRNKSEQTSLLIRAARRGKSPAQKAISKASRRSWKSNLFSPPDGGAGGGGGGRGVSLRISRAKIGQQEQNANFLKEASSNWLLNLDAL